MEIDASAPTGTESCDSTPAAPFSGHAAQAPAVPTEKKRSGHDVLRNSSHRRVAAKTVPYALTLLKNRNRNSSFGTAFRRVLGFQRADISQTSEITCMQPEASGSAASAQAPPFIIKLPAAETRDVAMAPAIVDIVQRNVREALVQLTDHTGLIHLEARLGRVGVVPKASTPAMDEDEPAASSSAPAQWPTKKSFIPSGPHKGAPIEGVDGTDTRMGIRVDVCVHVRMRMCVNMCTGMHTYLRIDMCAWADVDAHA